MNRELSRSTEAGQFILDAMMVYPSVTSTVYDQGLDVRDFYLDIHQRIFSAIMDITDSGKPVDVTTPIACLQDIEQLNLVDGADYTIKLSNTAISSASSMCYIEMIKSKTHLRRLTEAAEQIAEDGFDTTNDLDEIMGRAERDVLGITYSRRTTDSKSSQEVVSNAMQELIRLRSSDNHVTGIKTGYTDLDRMTNGFQCGDLIIPVARPVMGRTAFALNSALNTSSYNPGAIVILSLEMPAEALMKRILGIKPAVESNRLRNDAVLDDEFSKLNEATNELMVGELFVGNNFSIKISEMFSKCRKLKSEHGLDPVVIDYLQLTSGNEKNGDSRQQEISEISRPLKGLAREMEYPMIVLSQLSRSVETRPDKHPMLSDLRESGAIEQDADIVMSLYRDAYYMEDDETERNNPTGQTNFDIVKHRNGTTGKVELTFQRFISVFFNIIHGGFPQCRTVAV